MQYLRAMLAGIGAIALLAVSAPAQAGTLAPALRHLAALSPRDARARMAVASRPSLFAPRLTRNGRVQVYIHFVAGAAPAPQTLTALGATGVRTSERLGVVQAWVPLTRLRTFAALGGVTRIGVPLYAHVKLPTVTRGTSSTTVPSGLNIDAAGIAAEQVTTLLQNGITGNGVKVGVMSNGVDGLSASQNAGYLPTNVWVAPNLAGSGAEGTALLELTHAIAPGATLGFCGPATTVDFLTCYNDLANWGATIILDDLGFYGAYLYGYPAATNFLNGITSFAQNHPNISLVTSAGNDRQDYFQGNYVPDTNPNIISLSPTYTPSAGGTPGRSYSSAMNFGAAAGGGPDAVETVTIYPGCSGGCLLYAMLTWNDPLNGPYDDFDLFLVKPNGTVVASSTINQTTNATYGPNTTTYNPPAEMLTYTNKSTVSQTFYLAVLCYRCPYAGAGNPNFRFKLYGNMNAAGTFNYLTGGSVGGHAGLAAELTAAAAHANNTSGTSATLEPFSATAPFIYGDWQAGVQSLNKPEITAIDDVTVSGAGGFSSPLYGTSASAPNTGAVIALLRGQNSNAATNATGWNMLLMNNASTSRLTNYAQKAAGAGLVDALASARAIDGPMTAAITAPSASPIQINPNTAVTFTGSCTYGGAQMLKYQWGFGGNSGIADSTSLDPAPVQYADGGVYTVKFTCTDALQSAAATKGVEVQAAASAVDQSLTVQDGQHLMGQLGGTGIGGEQVSYSAAALPAHGRLSVSTSTGTFTYMPNSGYSGADSFQFVINNGVAKSNVATVSITVTQAAPSSGGGGGFGGAALGLLAALAMLARRRR